MPAQFGGVKLLKGGRHSRGEGYKNKSQIPNSKSPKNPKSQAPKTLGQAKGFLQGLVFGVFWSLGFGAWRFKYPDRELQHGWQPTGRLNRAGGKGLFPAWPAQHLFVLGLQRALLPAGAEQSDGALRQ